MPTMLLINSGDMPTKDLGGRKLRTCRQCGESWFSQKGKTPQRCAFCNSRGWERKLKEPGRPRKDAKQPKGRKRR